jgi:hypothetical protein
MSECANLDEFNAKWTKNSKISGSGSETVVHDPCPFCAEENFQVYSIADTSAAHARGAVCRHCRRGVRRIVNLGDIGWTAEFVQTCGPDAPPWLRPIRRYEAMLQ